MSNFDFQNRISADKIVSLKENEIFCFGSNLSGRHGKGAAKTALKWGAKMGQSKGLQGQTYGIPTKDASVQRVLGLDEIKPFVEEFIDFAKKNPNLIFLVTEIGCGLSKMSPRQIAPLFKDAISVQNIHLPIRFWNKLIKSISFKVIIAGSRDFNNYDLLVKKCDKILSQIDNKIEIVSGKASGADTLGENYAKDRGYPVEPFPADWNNLGKKAGYIRNEEMAKYADALIAFWDGESKGTKNMIELAKKYNLKTKVILFKNY